jgi:hypothetical protein
MITHTIDGITYRLHPDGALEMTDENGEVFTFEPGALGGLLAFLRWPGVLPTWRAAELKRQSKVGKRG